MRNGFTIQGALFELAVAGVVIILVWAIVKAINRYYRRWVYRRLLKDPRWTELATRVKARDGWMCVACAYPYNLEVHHKFGYIKGRKPWEYPLWWFVTLCHVCHSFIERRRKVVKRSIKIYRG